MEPINLEFYAEKIEIIRQKNQRIAEMMSANKGIIIFFKIFILKIKLFLSNEKI